MCVLLLIFYTHLVDICLLADILTTQIDSLDCRHVFVEFSVPMIP